MLSINSNIPLKKGRAAQNSPAKIYENFRKLQPTFTDIDNN
jgi:hypothetical protein